MKWLTTLLGLFFVTTLNAIAPPANPIEIVVVITSYNNEKWVHDNLTSVINQQYPYFSVIYINDCSNDKTGAMVDRFIATRHLESKVKVIHNTERKGALENIYNAVHSLPPHKVVVNIDGDDTLSKPTALTRVAKAYQSGRVWMTYGDFATNNPNWRTCCERIPDKVAEKRSFRSYKWVASHLRTFYAKLFQKIRKEDLMWKGKFFPMTWDMAFMFPMLEMSAKHHYKFIREVLYIYNVTNPLNDYRVNAELQRELDAYVRNMPRYHALNRLF